MADLSTIKISFTQAQRTAISELLPILSTRLKLDEPGSRTILFSALELRVVQHNAEEAIPPASNKMKRNSLRHIVEVLTIAFQESEGIGAIPHSERLYQFKITLLDSKPPIWRRIQIKNGTLEKLHEHIQTAMGWTNSHLHQFEINGERYGDPRLLDNGWEEFTCLDSTITKITDIIPRSGERFSFQYEYDFGDGWEHEILFEGCLAAEKGGRYPLCLEGERTCPPEDVGGIRGYNEFLQALADPEHERHEEFLNWAGEFDPDDFETEKTTKKMRRGLPNRRQY